MRGVLPRIASRLPRPSHALRWILTRTPNIHRVSGKVKAEAASLRGKTAQRGNNPHGVLYGLSLDAARPIEGRREPKPATSRRMTAETNGAFAKIRDNARSVGLDKESVAAVRQFSRTNIHPVPGKVKSAFFAEKAAGRLEKGGGADYIICVPAGTGTGLLSHGGTSTPPKSGATPRASKEIFFFMGACRFA